MGESVVKTTVAIEGCAEGLTVVETAVAVGFTVGEGVTSATVSTEGWAEGLAVVNTAAAVGLAEGEGVARTTVATEGWAEGLEVVDTVGASVDSPSSPVTSTSAQHRATCTSVAAVHAGAVPVLLEPNSTKYPPSHAVLLQTRLLSPWQPVARV